MINSSQEVWVSPTPSKECPTLATIDYDVLFTWIEVGVAHPHYIHT